MSQVDYTEAKKRQIIEKAFKACDSKASVSLCPGDILVGSSSACCACDWEEDKLHLIASYEFKAGSKKETDAFKVSMHIFCLSVDCIVEQHKIEKKFLFSRRRFVLIHDD